MKPNHGDIENMSRVENLKFIEERHMAHLACHSRDEVYLVPISYAFEDGYIYCHSKPGKKVEMIRHIPQVCIQIEQIENFFHWKSVIAWGVMEELQGNMANQGMRLLISTFLAQDNDYAPELKVDFAAQIERAIVFRMKIDKTSGRSEGKFKIAL
jgi:nitroimidazol reductase NimA-like FMN-containing flavoprotein (pyridoxamine 5'-phosphate oxidase superfamily)